MNKKKNITSHIAFSGWWVACFVSFASLTKLRHSPATAAYAFSLSATLDAYASYQVQCL